jgi:hypothetical protein
VFLIDKDLEQTGQSILSIVEFMNRRCAECRTLSHHDLLKLIKYQFSLQRNPALYPRIGVAKLKPSAQKRIEANSFLSCYRKLIEERALARNSASPQKAGLDEETELEQVMSLENRWGEEAEFNAAAPYKKKGHTEQVVDWYVSDDEDGGVRL